jgi:hypothetical protein
MQESYAREGVAAKAKTSDVGKSRIQKSENDLGEPALAPRGPI